MKRLFYALIISSISFPLRAHAIDFEYTFFNSPKSGTFTAKYREKKAGSPAVSITVPITAGETKEVIASNVAAEINKVYPGTATAVDGIVSGSLPQFVKDESFKSSNLNRIFKKKNTPTPLPPPMPQNGVIWGIDAPSDPTRILGFGLASTVILELDSTTFISSTTFTGSETEGDFYSLLLNDLFNKGADPTQIYSIISWDIDSQTSISFTAQEVQVPAPPAILGVASFLKSSRSIRKRLRLGCKSK